MEETAKIHPTGCPPGLNLRAGFQLLHRRAPVINNCHQVYNNKKHQRRFFIRPPFRCWQVKFTTISNI
jgi:hypothetical protein